MGNRMQQERAQLVGELGKACARHGAQRRRFVDRFEQFVHYGLFTLSAP